MVPFGGIGVMVLGALLSGALLSMLALVLVRRLGVVAAWSIAGLLWSLLAIALVTLLPADAAPGVVPLEEAQRACSFDYGGPAPEGFWIFSGTQRTLNTALFVPPGALVVLAVARWRAAWILAPLGLALLVAYSVSIEYAQLELARIDRACDLTDMVDNTAGAVVGFGIGVFLATVLRPWRARRGTRR